MSFNITLPNRNGTNVSEQLETSNNLVIIGANGAGKTRLGIWIEEQIQNQVTVHRISAQKALSIPEFAQIKNLEQAEKELFFVSVLPIKFKSRLVFIAPQSSSAIELIETLCRLTLFLEDVELRRNLPIFSCHLTGIFQRVIFDL